MTLVVRSFSVLFSLGLADKLTTCMRLKERERERVQLLSLEVVFVVVVVNWISPFIIIPMSYPCRGSCLLVHSNEATGLSKDAC